MNPSSNHIEIIRAGKKLESLLARLNISSLPVSDYSKTYFNSYLQKLPYAIDASVKTISAGLQKTEKKPEDVIVAESGGGLGVLSMLANLSGFKKVIYNDLFEGSCNDYQVIARAIGLNPSLVVHGDSADISRFAKAEGLIPDLVVSRNVIEHVYNIQDYLAEFHNMNPQVVLSFSTTANYSNPLTRIYTRKIHHKLEYQGTGTHYGKKASDAPESYLDLRLNFIRQQFPDLSPSKTDQLGKLTRGLTFKEIPQFVSDHLAGKPVTSGVLNTNTCDPNTGNWAEQLVPAPMLKEMFFNAGFSLSILPGEWNRHYPKWWMKMAAGVLNTKMTLFPFLRIPLSPYIILLAAGNRK